MENGDYIVAIDLGTNTVVAMIGTKGEDGRIRVIDREVSAVQGAGMIRGEIKNIDLVSRSIKEAVDAIGERQGIRITEAYAGISGQHIRSVKQPLLRICQPRRGDPPGGRPPVARQYAQRSGLPKGRKSCRSFRRTTLSTTRRRRPIRSGRSATNWRRRSTSYWAIRSRSTGWRWPSNGWISFRSGFS